MQINFLVWTQPNPKWHLLLLLQQGRKSQWWRCISAWVTFYERWGPSLFDSFLLRSVGAGALAGFPRDFDCTATKQKLTKKKESTIISNGSIYSFVQHKEEGNKLFYGYEPINMKKKKNHLLAPSSLAPCIRTIQISDFWSADRPVIRAKLMSVCRRRSRPAGCGHVGSHCKKKCIESRLQTCRKQKTRPTIYELQHKQTQNGLAFHSLYVFGRQPRDAISSAVEVRLVTSLGASFSRQCSAACCKLQKLKQVKDVNIEKGLHSWAENITKDGTHPDLHLLEQLH